MVLVLRLAVLLLATGSALAQTAPVAAPTLAQTLRAGRGQNRLLLLVAPRPDHADFQAQQTLLAPVKAGLAARDLHVLDVFYAGLSPADRQELAGLGVRGPGFALVLIGKDGGVKRRSNRPLAPADLFRTIDQMPMRRQELRRAGAAAPPR